MDPSMNASEKRYRIIYLLFLFCPFVYIALMLMMIYRGLDFSIDFEDGGFIVSFMSASLGLISLATLVLIGWIKNWFWGIKKKMIHSAEDFSMHYFSYNMFYIAFLEAIGIYGLLIFFLSGELLLPVGMNLLSFIAMLYHFPKEKDKEAKMKQLHFDRMNT